MSEIIDFRAARARRKPEGVTKPAPVAPPIVARPLMPSSPRLGLNDPMAVVRLMGEAFKDFPV